MSLSLGYTKHGQLLMAVKLDSSYKWTGACSTQECYIYHATSSCEVAANFTRAPQHRAFWVSKLCRTCVCLDVLTIM